MLLRGKVVLVTGGAGGRVGPGISRALARHGAAVAVNYCTSRERGEQLLEQIAAFGGTAKLWPCDCKDTEAVKAMVDDIVAAFGRIDGVVNNAYSGGQSDGWGPADWDHFTDCFESEVKMALNTIHAARPFMQKQRGGRIVNICSEQWNEAGGGATYATSLGARVAISRWLVRKLAADNITINMIAPCATRDIRPVVKPWDQRNDYEQSIPLGRIADAEEIGDACAFFISNLAKFISGAYLQVNGGHLPQMGA